MSMPKAHECAPAEPRSSPRSVTAGHEFDIGKRKDVRAVFCHHESVLELSGAATVGSHNRPTVIPLFPVDGAQIEHRLDCEDHARLDFVRVVRSGVIVGDDETGVEFAPDPVTRVVANNSVAEAFRVLFDDPADDVDRTARLDGLDACLLYTSDAADDTASV